MAKRPTADADRLRRAAQASGEAVRDGLVRRSSLAVSDATYQRYSGGAQRLVGRTPRPSSTPYTPVQAYYQQFGAGFGAIGPAAATETPVVETQRFLGAGSTASPQDHADFFARLEERLRNGELMVDSEGRLIEVPDLLTDEERERLADPSAAQEAAVGSGGMYPVPGLGAGEFRSPDETEEDQASSAIARRTPFVSRSLERAYERARDEAALRRINAGFHPARTAFSGNWDDEDARVSWLYENYPTVALAAYQQGLSNDQVASITNLAMAQDTAREILEEPIVPRRRQMIAALPPTQAALVQSIIADMAEEARRDEALRPLADDDVSVVRSAMSLVWGSVGPLTGQDEETGDVANRVASPAWVLDVLFDVAEFGQHVGRAVALDVGERDFLGRVGYAAQSFYPGLGLARIAVTAISRWEETDLNAWNKDGLIEARKKYGDADVDIVIEMVNARNDGSTQAFWNVLDTIKDNPRGMQIFMSALRNVDTDPEITEMIQFISAQTNSNLGNIAARGAGFEPGSLPFDASRDVANVVGFFALDPFIVGYVAWKPVQLARYGLYNLMKADEGADIGQYLARAIKGSDAGGIKGAVQNWWYGTPNVRRYLDWYGSELERIRGLSGLERSNAMNTLRSQSKRYFDEDVMSEALKAGVKNADTFYDWLQGADDFARILRGQGSKRGKDMMIPHMSRATEAGKAVSLQVRGLDPTRWITQRAEREMAIVLGDDFVRMTPEQQRAKLLSVLQSEDETIRLATALSDLRGTRSRIGRIVSKMGKQVSFADNQKVSWKQKYGWQRKRAESMTDFMVRWADRISRGGARFPTSSTLRLNTGKDAHTVYEMMRGAGLPRYWASYMRSAWVEMEPGQRRLVAAGLARTYGYAAGIHLVDRSAPRYLDEIMTGFKSADSYGVPLSEDLIKAGLKGPTDNLDLSAPLRTVDPSVRNGVSSGISYGQTADQVVLPNFGAIDALRARSSWMNAILMQNAAGTSLTDWWVLATLAGPRFAFRNAVEDAALYAMTSGSVLGYWRGRQISTALRESTPRVNRSLQVKDNRVSEAKEELAKARRLGDQDKILKAEEVLETARINLIEEQLLFGTRGHKLGLAKTFGRYLGDVSAKVPLLRNIILPHLGRGEIAQAAKAAREGNRELLNDLLAKAFLRQKLQFLKTPEGLAFTRGMRNGVDVDDLPAGVQVILRDLDDFINSPYGFEQLKESSQQIRHMLDGTLTQEGGGSVRIIGGTVYLKQSEGLTYAGSKVANPGTPDQVNGVLASLNFVLHTDGPKGQRAMALLPEYFAAIASGKVADRERIVRELARFIEKSSDETFDYVGRFSLASAPDTEQLARATLDNLAAMFTRQSGKFHDDLYNKLKMPEQYPGVPRFKLYYTDKDGNKVDNVTSFDFAEGMIDMPAYTNVRHSEGVWIPQGNLMNLPSAAWEAMGRSYARMTREPIYLSNYLEARAALRPFENRLIKMGESPEAARKRVTEIAGDRALETTLAYVDNPMIRSRIAWSVRNIARFYRAQEDFIRRMVRVSENYPMGFYKAAVGWEALQEIGFVHEDTYGQQYFVYPGSGAGLDAVNRASRLLGMDAPQGSVPLAFAGNVQWITPSADPDAWNPALSSFWAGFGIKGVLRSLPMFNSQMQELSRFAERELFGSVGLDQGWDRSFVPPNVTRVFNLYQAFTAKDPSGAQIPGNSLAGAAFRRSALALAASGHIPTDEIVSPDELRKFRQIMDTQATNALVVLAISGLMLPSSPQLTVDDVSTFARELGVQGLRPAFLEMVKKYGFDEGYLRWVQTNPELAIFTVSESTSGSIGRWETTKETIDFVRNNLKIMEEAPNGLSYFAPINGEDTPAAFNYLRAMGLSSKSDPGDYLLKLMNAQGSAQQFVLRQWRDTEVAKATSKEDIAAIDKVYRSQKRLVDDKFGMQSVGNSYSTPQDFQAEWKSIRTAAEQLVEKDKSNLLAQKVMEIDLYYQDRLSQLRESNQMLSGDAQAVRNDLREGWSRWLDAVFAENDDERLELILRIATGALFGSGGTWPWSLGYGVGESE